MKAEKHADRLERLRLAGMLGWPEYEGCVSWHCEQGRVRDLPRVHESRFVQALYVAMRIDGASHAMAEMLALASPPMSNTDREFLQGQGGCYDQFGGNELVGDYYKAQAARAGVDTTGAVYLSGLAAFPGDPKAWVRGRGDAQRVLEERGWSSEGSVRVRGREPEPADRKWTAAPDLVAERAEKLVAAGAAKPGEEAAHKATESLLGGR